ncbi:hypothetical protein GE061_013512 [Apolygus lucorum]|uniref:CCHC-type domain-containing protein n=1 Tax=Apolygus lucorum TaxID=248454 RepID=A0A8S9XN61_APOLU|nr:hypothetical protein GE061_013512 [Apolygus lucorum]
MNPFNLDPIQMDFELLRLGLPITDDPNVKARRLNLGILLGNPAVRIEVDAEEEYEYCAGLLEGIKAEAASIKAKTRSTKVVRLETKILHIIHRLENAKLAGGVDSQKIGSLVEEARGVTKEIEVGLMMRLNPENASESELSDSENPRIVVPKSPKTPLRNSGQAAGAGPDRKYVPVYKWGIKKFDGSGTQDALDFIRLVEEKSRSRFVPSNLLLEESADLFEGRALVWHREAFKRVETWAELVKEFKIAFKVHAADGMVRDQIRNTKQGDEESIDMFLSIMLDKYDRLERPLQEVDKLEEILKNLNPFLKDQLYSQQIGSIEHLRKLARKAEAGRLRMNGEVTKSTKESSRHRDIAIMDAAAPRASMEESSNRGFHRNGSGMVCFNCKKRGHGFRECREEKRTFCFRCGTDNVTAWNCVNCNPAKNS